MPTETHELPVTKLTHGPKLHWFGYYDKFPWDVSGRWLLAMETDFDERSPKPGETIRLGRLDLQGDRTFQPFAETAAWNWQQGTHLQWLPGQPDTVIYNTLAGDRFAAVVHNLATGAKRELPLPIYAVSRSGRQAVTLNFSRVASTRPGYGYNALPQLAGPDLPDDDGVWSMDLATGDHRLLFSVRQIQEMGTTEAMAGARHWFNHLQYSTDDSRFVFLHRWRHDVKRFYTRMFTANPDGSDVWMLNDKGASHFDWQGPKQILCWSPYRDEGLRYVLYHDLTREMQVVGADVFQTDGHCSYSPDGKWMLTDTYPDKELKRTLILYNIAENRRVNIGRFWSRPVNPPDPHQEVRVDLHPRWSRDGRSVCFDSTHEGERQMYLIDVSPVVG